MITYDPELGNIIPEDKQENALHNDHHPIVKLIIEPWIPARRNREADRWVVPFHAPILPWFDTDEAIYLCNTYRSTLV